MKLPRTVSVLGDLYKIKRVKTIKGEGKRTDETGLCDVQAKEIQVIRDCGEDAMHILLHEISHAMFYRLGLFDVIDEQLEEVLSTQIANLVLDNFRLVKK